MVRIDAGIAQHLGQRRGLGAILPQQPEGRIEARLDIDGGVLGARRFSGPASRVGVVSGEMISSASSKRGSKPVT